MSEIKLEVNKTYRTRDGRKAKCIYASLQEEKFLLIVGSLTDTSGEEIHWYLSNGTALAYGACIVSEWHEPQYAWLNVYEHAEGMLWSSGPYSSRSKADNCCSSTRVSRIKVELKRGVWDE